MAGPLPTNAAFQRLIEALELTPAQQSRADGRQIELRRALRDGLDLDPGRPTFLTGSFARGTSIRPLNDIDLFAVHATPPSDRPPTLAPVTAMGRVHGALRVAYPDAAEPVPQDHTVRVDFARRDRRDAISFEVVPAFRRAAGGFWIPEKASDRWIASDPDEHAAVTRRANAHTSGRAGAMVKLAKSVKRAAGVPIASFHLEMIVCLLASDGFADHPRALSSLLARIAERVMSPLPDPARIGPAIDERLTAADRARLHAAFVAAADDAAHALRLEASDLDGAHWLWRKLLGHLYPEAGRKPQVGVTPRRAPGIDAEGSRFG